MDYKENVVGLTLQWVGERAEIIVNEPSLEVKQHGFRSNESTFLIKMVLAAPPKKPPSDPNGWKALAKPEEAIVTFSDKKSTDKVYVCNNVKLNACRIINNGEGAENSIEFEITIG